MSSIKILLIFGILSVFCESALSIKCYRCESDNVENCGEHFNEEGVLLDDCSKASPPRHLMLSLGSNINSTGCAKVMAERNGAHVVIRTCYFGDLSNTERGCTPNPFELIHTLYKSCEVCSKDACNGSNMIGPITILILITTAFERLIIK